MSLSRDGFAREEPIFFDNSLDRIAFRLENRFRDRHETVLNIGGLPPGSYQLSVGDKATSKFRSEPGAGLRLNIPVPTEPAISVTIERD